MEFKDEIGAWNVDEPQICDPIDFHEPASDQSELVD